MNTKQIQPKMMQFILVAIGILLLTACQTDKPKPPDTVLSLKMGESILFHQHHNSIDFKIEQHAYGVSRQVIKNVALQLTVTDGITFQLDHATVVLFWNAGLLHHVDLNTQAKPDQALSAGRINAYLQKWISILQSADQWQPKPIPDIAYPPVTQTSDINNFMLTAVENANQYQEIGITKWKRPLPKPPEAWLDKYDTIAINLISNGKTTTQAAPTFSIFMRIVTHANLRDCIFRLEAYQRQFDSQNQMNDYVGTVPFFFDGQNPRSLSMEEYLQKVASYTKETCSLKNTKPS